MTANRGVGEGVPPATRLDGRAVVLVVRVVLDEVAVGVIVGPAPIAGALRPDTAAPVLVALQRSEVAPSDAGERDRHRETAPAEWKAAPERIPRIAHAPRARLSAREIEVLRLLTAGWTNPEIAATLTLSPGTVARHTANIYAKVGARGRADAVAYAVQNGLTEPPSSTVCTNHASPSAQRPH